MSEMLVADILVSTEILRGYRLNESAVFPAPSA